MAILRIEFELGAPVVLDAPLHLDSLILAEYSKECGSEVFKGDNLIELDFIDKLRDMYLASAGFLVATEGLEYWHKRFDTDNLELVDFKGRSEKINIGSGKFKSYKMPLRVFATKKIVFFVKGDKKKITKYVKMISGIGKKRAYGYGIVKRAVISEIPRSLYLFSNVQPTRYIPCSFLNEFKMYPQKFVIRYAPYKPPYWYRPFWTKCIGPTKFVFKSPEEFKEFLGVDY